MISQVIPKQPVEEFYIGIDFEPALPPGRAISYCLVTAIDNSTGANVSSTLLGSPAAAVSGAETSVLLKGGTNHSSYKVTFRATLDDNEIIEEDITVVVED